MIFGIDRASDLGPSDDREEMAWESVMETITEDDVAVENVAAALADSVPDLIAALSDPGVTDKYVAETLAKLRTAAAPLWQAEARAKLDAQQEARYV
jgi:hypothetical protein